MTLDERKTFYVRFGRAVRDRRVALGLSQADLAEPLQLTRASVANIEAGRQQVALHSAAVLAERLRLPLAALLPGEQDEPEDDPARRLLMTVSPQWRHDVARVLGSAARRTPPTADPNYRVSAPLSVKEIIELRADE